MSVSANKEIVRRFIEIGGGARNPQVFTECLHPQFRWHRSGAVSSGQEDARLALERVSAGLPDYEVTIELLAGEDDLVAVRSRTRGTHAGPYFGMAPTGRRVDFTAVDFYRLLDGKIVESWHNVDEGGLLRQLGALPERGLQGPRPAL